MKGTTSEAAPARRTVRSWPWRSLGLPVAAGGPASRPRRVLRPPRSVPCLSDPAAMTASMRVRTRTCPSGASTPTPPRSPRRTSRRSRRRRPAGRYVTREVRPRLAARVNIPVYVHVIKGTHRGERVPAGPRRVRAAGRDPQPGHGRQPERPEHPAALPVLAQEDRLHEARRLVPRLPQRSRATSGRSGALHRGNARTLNLYINGGGPRGTRCSAGPASPGSTQAPRGWTA